MMVSMIKNWAVLPEGYVSFALFLSFSASQVRFWFFLKDPSVWISLIFGGISF